MILLVEQPSMNMLTLLYFVTSKQPKKKRYPQNPIKSAATNTTHQEYTSQGAPTYPYFSKLLKRCIFQLYQSHSALSIPENTASFSGLQRRFDLNMENTFQNYQAKKAYHPERIVDDTFPTIHGFSTLAANIV